MKNWVRKWIVCSRNSTGPMVGLWIIELHRVIDRVGLNPDETFDTLSGGNKSQAMLAVALVRTTFVNFG